jgi:hypothetical protein
MTPQPSQQLIPAPADRISAILDTGNAAVERHNKSITTEHEENGGLLDQ